MEEIGSFSSSLTISQLKKSRLFSGLEPAERGLQVFVDLVHYYVVFDFWWCLYIIVVVPCLNSDGRLQATDSIWSCISIGCKHDRPCTFSSQECGIRNGIWTMRISESRGGLMISWNPSGFVTFQSTMKRIQFVHGILCLVCFDPFLSFDGSSERIR